MTTITTQDHKESIVFMGSDMINFPVLNFRSETNPSILTIRADGSIVVGENTNIEKDAEAILDWMSSNLNKKFTLASYREQLFDDLIKFSKEKGGYLSEQDLLDKKKELLFLEKIEGNTVHFPYYGT